MDVTVSTSVTEQHNITPVTDSVIYDKVSENIPEAGIIVYVSITGKYHAKSDCSGMTSCTAMDIAHAEAAGSEPCSRCIGEEESVISTLNQSAISPQRDDIPPQITGGDVVYVSSTGKYHSESDCSGMKSCTEMSISQALTDGCQPCSRCIGEEESVISTLNQSAISPQRDDIPPQITGGDVVYVSSTGKYHSKPDCSGMKSCTEMSISQAQAQDFIPCKKCYG